MLLLTGPVGVGKSTVAREASRLLAEANIAHALVDLPGIGSCWPRPADDPWNERLIHRNLACMWANFQRSGAERLLLCRVLEARSLLRHIRQAVPGADFSVVGLRAPLPILHARIAAREAGRDASQIDWYRNAAAVLVDRLENALVEDHCIDNVDRPVDEVAAEALRLVGWLP